MSKQRDLFRAIVLSGAALTAGCPGPATTDAGSDTPAAEDTGAGDTGEVLADAGPMDASGDAPVISDVPTEDAGEDAFVAIL